MARPGQKVSNNPETFKAAGAVLSDAVVLCRSAHYVDGDNFSDICEKFPPVYEDSDHPEKLPFDNGVFLRIIAEIDGVPDSDQPWPIYHFAANCETRSGDKLFKADEDGSAVLVHEDAPDKEYSLRPKDPASVFLSEASKLALKPDMLKKLYENVSVLSGGTYHATQIPDKTGRKRTAADGKEYDAMVTIFDKVISLPGEKKAGGKAASKPAAKTDKTDKSAKPSAKEKKEEKADAGDAGNGDDQTREVATEAVKLAIKGITAENIGMQDLDAFALAVAAEVKNTKAGKKIVASDKGAFRELKKGVQALVEDAEFLKELASEGVIGFDEDTSEAGPPEE